MPAAQKHKLLIDAGVLMDVLTGAPPDSEASAGLLSIFEAGLAEGWISIIDLAKVNQALHGGMSSARARSVMQEIVSLVQVSPVDRPIVLAALAFGWNDFSHAVTAAIAQAQRMDHVITRDPNAYRSLQQSVLTPEQYLTKHSMPAP